MITRPRSKRRIQRTLHLDLESLDDRIVPSTIGAGRPITPPLAMVQVRPETQAPPMQPLNAHRGGHGNPANETALPANVAPRLRLVYARYMTSVGMAAGGAIAPSQFSQAVVGSARVDVNVHTTDTAHFQGQLEQLRDAGLRVTRASAASGNVSGILPIVSLPAVANLSPALIVTIPTNMDWRLQALDLQYQAFVNAGGEGTFSPTGVEGLQIDGTHVGVKVSTLDGRQFARILAELESDGLRVTQHSLLDGVIDGKLPIGQLPTVAKISPMVTIKPLIEPRLR
jgi:hypothetical protein